MFTFNIFWMYSHFQQIFASLQIGLLAQIHVVTFCYFEHLMAITNLQERLGNF